MPGLDEQIVEAQRDFLTKLDETSAHRFIHLLERSGMTEKQAIARANELLGPLKLRGLIRAMDRIVAEVEAEHRVLETQHFSVMDRNGKIAVLPRNVSDQLTSEFITDDAVRIHKLLEDYVGGLRDLTTRNLIGDAMESLRETWVRERELQGEGNG